MKLYKSFKYTYRYACAYRYVCAYVCMCTRAHAHGGSVRVYMYISLSHATCGCVADARMSVSWITSI